jgi:hypothetical protein
MELGSVDYLAGSVQDSVQSIVRHFNVDYFTLHLFRGGDDAKNTPYVRTNYPDAWVSRYLLHDYVRIDPVLQMTKKNDRAFLFVNDHPRCRTSTNDATSGRTWCGSGRL